MLLTTGNARKRNQGTWHCGLRDALPKKHPLATGIAKQLPRSNDGGFCRRRLCTEGFRNARETNVGHHSDAQSFRDAILVCRGSRCAYAHAHFLDRWRDRLVPASHALAHPEVNPQPEREPARDEPEREARSTEAVRGKRLLGGPASDLNAGRRPSVNDPVTKS